MWKCFNRGVWETIDRSVNVFKADTSSGTCLISSLAKDLDAINEEIRNKPQPCNEDNFGICPVSEECSLPGEHQGRRQIVNRTVKIHDHARSSRFFSHELRNLSAVRASHIFDKSPASSVSEDVNPKPGVNNSCIGRTIHGKCDSECPRDSRPSPDSGHLSEAHLVGEGRLLYLDESREANAKWKLRSQPLCKSTKSLGFLEERGQSSSKLHLACLPKGNFFSLFRKVILLRDGQDVKDENVVSSKKEIQSHDLVHSNSDSDSYCILKLPFHCYDHGRFKGLKAISASWLIKPRSEFGRGDREGTDGEQSGESEETKEDAWRECQMHQSLLEAIGWSSAVLLGWFLGQCRFWHTHGELRRGNNSENKRKCFIIGSLAKLLVTWRGDTALPLKVLPCERDGISKDFRSKKGSKVQGSETTIINEPDSECPPHSFPLLESEENSLCGRHSSRSLTLQQAEDTSFHEDHLKQKLSAVNETQKNNAIPMPWHVDSVKNLAFGPITLEEAIKEAGKGLEEAQAEVLLTLALEKLNEGCSATENEPLPANLFQSAASLGSTAAAFNLGICYEKGVGGVVKNLVQAYHWYKQASEQGHAAATYNLAVFHANGLGGLHPNTFLANQLLLRASSLGLEEATNALGLISSYNTSEKFCNYEECSSLRNHVSLDQGNSESSKSLKTPNISKSHSPEGVVYHESYHGSSNDLSISLMGIRAVSHPSEYFKETSKMSSLKIGHLLMSHGITLNNTVDADRPLLDEMMFDDHHCIKNTGVDNSSIQLLAH